MLMELMQGAAVEHGLSLISTDQGQRLFQKAEEPCERAPIEVLVDDPAFSEFGRQGSESGTVEHHIP